MRIDYEHDLNPAQLEAATTLDGPVLVIAGAGSGKTRTIVYRLARLAERGVSPEEILLLTFTRKASSEMLERAQGLLGHRGLGSVRGGTFHGFAFSLLKQYAGLLGFSRGVTVMDRADGEDVLAQAKDRLKIGSHDRKFPKRATILGLYSKSRNKELSLSEVLRQEAYHLGVYEGDLVRLLEEYERIARMVSDMLFLAKAEDNRLAHGGEAVDLAREADALIEFYQALADEHEIRIVREGRAVVSGDRLMLRRAPQAVFLSEEWQKEMKKIENCLHCNTCVSRCPYELDIPKMLVENFEDYKKFRAEYLAIQK